MKHTYKDFVTGKVRWTAGQFICWTQPTGPLRASYAIFQRRASRLFIPEYCLTPETRKALPPVPGLKKNEQ